MSIVNTLALESNRQIKINFDGGDLSSDAGLLLIKEFVSKLGIDKLFVKSFKTNDSALFGFSMPPGYLCAEGFHSPTPAHQLVSVYHPQSMQKYSHPASAAASIRGSSFSVVESPNRQFM